jgi:hypothetical protein
MSDFNDRGTIDAVHEPASPMRLVATAIAQTAGVRRGYTFLDAKSVAARNDFEAPRSLTPQRGQFGRFSREKLRMGIHRRHRIGHPGL